MKKLYIRLLVVMLVVSLGTFQSVKVFADEVVAESEGVVIETGDAVVDIDAGNLVNENNVDVAGSTTATTTTTTATTTDAVDTEATSTEAISVEVASDNAATTTISVEAEALTGDNMASSTATTSIQTGDAYANANIVNVVNVNVFNSDGLFTFLDRFLAGDDTVDLRDLSLDGSDYRCDTCVVSTSTLSSYITGSYSATNTASITNDVIVRSHTGDNVASGTQSTIQTGDAYANANVVNIANANFIDSKYVMLVLNNFGDWKGDLVLPDASFFDEFLSQQYALPTQDLDITNTNQATISSTVSVLSDTGNNTASSTGDGSITTGNALTSAYVHNEVNTNQYGGNSFGIVFRVFGNWSGQIFNLPTQGMVNGIPFGLEVFTDSVTMSVPQTGSTNLSFNNSASINNKVEVSAETGNNAANGDSVSIATGNAYANANVVNIANTNVVGRNWITAIINIFGDWDGNVSFGQPDLWIGSRADFPQGNFPGATMKYHFTVKNNGDALATNIKLNQIFDAPYITLIGESPTIDRLQPGETREVIQEARIVEAVPLGDTPVLSTITVRATETDAHLEDNKDEISVMILRSIPINSGNNNQGNTGSSTPLFAITKTHTGINIVTASSSVDYTINVKNNGGYAAHALLVDKLVSDTGEVIHEEQWDLGEVFAGEEITVTYTVQFNAQTKPGIYYNTAQIFSADNSFPESVVASSGIVIESYHGILSPMGAVLPKTHVVPRVTYAPEKTIVSTTTPSATSSLALAAFIANDTVLDNTNLLAGVYAALGALAEYWYWWLLLLLVIAYAYKRYSDRRDEGYLT